MVIETPNILILRDSFRQKPLKPPSDKPMLIVSNRLKTTMMSKGMTTLTEPSSSGTRRLMSANDESMPLPTEQLQQRQLPNVHPEDSFLYCMPKGVHPTYRAVPLVVKLSILVLAMWTSAVTTWKRLTWLQPLAILGGLRQKPTVAQILSFVTKVGIQRMNGFVISFSANLITSYSFVLYDGINHRHYF